jgi:cytochrome P450
VPTADLITRLGDVVRIAPNEIVFFSAQALNGKLAQFPVCSDIGAPLTKAMLDIVMSGQKGKPTFTKTEHYFVFGKHVGIASERNPETHRILRKALSPAFSPKAIREHDVDCHKVVDLALAKLERRGTKGEGVNVSEVSLCKDRKLFDRD